MKYVFDISIITLFYWFICEESIGYLKNYKFKGFLTVFWTQSNVPFCRWFELYGFFCLIFLCAPLIKMRGFVLTNGWMVQITTLLMVQNSYFEKVWLINLISTYANLLQYFIFACFLLIKHNKKCALQKELVIGCSLKQLLFESLTDNAISS